MDFHEGITAMNSSLLFTSTSTSSPSPQSSLGNLPSDDQSLPLSVIRPCGACKGLRRRCVAECILAPYFPPTQPDKFLAVRKVFGANNVSKVLQELPESQRDDAVKSMVYEATIRIRDPVYGCSGVICSMQKLVNQLQMELATAKAQILNMTFQQKNPPAATMTCMEMKEAQLPMFQQPSLEDFMFCSTPTFHSCENNSFFSFDVTDNGGGFDTLFCRLRNCVSLSGNKEKPFFSSKRIS